jgi:glutamate-1-semialdehyde 2,1-aminomutase
MDWCSFGKNGSDALNIALIIARAYNNRSKILCFNGAYHGSHLWCNWCNPGEGRPLDDSMKIIQADWNNCEQLEKIFKESDHQISSIVLTPFHHPIGKDAEMPTEEFIASVNECCKRHGVLLILDDVRTGFRLSLEGSHKYFGFRPHLTCLSKAIANTYPLAVTMGTSEVFEAASKVFIAGTFWNNAAPMVAAIENICLLHEKGLDQFQVISQMFCNGLTEVGSKYGFDINVTGPAPIPTLTFKNDDPFELVHQFAAGMTKCGSFIHPSHNWFLSLAHTEEDIATSLSHAEHTLQKMSKAVSLKTTV